MTSIRTLTLAAALGAAAPGIGPVAAIAQEAPAEGTYLSISADGVVVSTPDVASVSAGVMTRAATAREALAANSKEMSKIMAALRKAGVAERDIQTSNIMVNPEYAYPENEAAKLTGYVATNDVIVTVRDLKRLGPAIDAVAAAGANQINSVGFSLSNQDAVMAEARAKAMKEARDRAELYAKAAGMKVTKILSISEGQPFSPVPTPPVLMARAEADMAAPPAPVSPGELSTMANVVVAFELR
jgi:uncharacterized protein YggE